MTAGTRGCSLLPEFPKGWRDHGVDPGPIIAAIGIEEPVVAAQMTGLPAPVLQQVAPEEYERNADKVQAALLEISRQMGHERTPIVHAYTGSPAGECKRANQQLKAWSDILAGMTHEFQGVGAEEAWIVGPCAKGLPVPHDGHFTIAVRYPAEPPSTSPEYHLAVEILRNMHLPMAITAALHVPVELVRWTDPNPPADGFEIIFQ